MESKKRCGKQGKPSKAREAIESRESDRMQGKPQNAGNRRKQGNPQTAREAIGRNTMIASVALTKKGETLKIGM